MQKEIVEKIVHVPINKIFAVDKIRQVSVAHSSQYHVKSK